MEIPGSTLITVQSSINSQQVEDGSSPFHCAQTGKPADSVCRPVTPLVSSTLPRQSEQHSISSHTRRKIVYSNTQSLESRLLEEIEEMDENEAGRTGRGSDNSDQLYDSDSTERIHKTDSQDEHIVVINSPTHLPYTAREDNHLGCGLHSVSTVLVGDEEGRVDSFEDEVSVALEWFRSTFDERGNGGRITLAVFKQAAMECEVKRSNWYH